LDLGRGTLGFFVHLGQGDSDFQGVLAPFD
jgi:hypothetical protein